MLKIQWYRIDRDILLLPGFCDVLKLACAVDFLHVSLADFGGAYGHEVRPRAADGVLSKVSQRLAHSCSEQEGAYNLVECCYVLVEVRVGVNPLAVDQISLSRGNLRKKGKQLKSYIPIYFPFFASLGWNDFSPPHTWTLLKAIQ